MVKNEFLRFLIKKGHVEAFLKNMDSHKSIEDIATLRNPITAAFTWCDTPEGDDFWRALDREYNRGDWKKELEKKYTMNEIIEIMDEIIKKLKLLEKGD